MNKVVTLNLRNLAEGIPSITSAMGGVHSEAAAVCLEDQGHSDPVQIHIRKTEGTKYFLSFPTVTEEMRRSYHDMQRSTELGACGIAIMLIRSLTSLNVVRQSKKGTGFDYWLGPDEGEDVLPFQNSARLEVSGILNGTDSQFVARLKKKLEQTKASDVTQLPAYAVVVEFSHPQAEVGER